MEKYSVLMSVYFKENPEYFGAAIESMLDQSIPPSEFVLICDGKLTEELDKVIDDYTESFPALVRVIRFKENCGLGEALRVGTVSCSNEIVARMDSDDIAVPDRMKWQLEVLQNDPSISVVGGQIQEFFGEIGNFAGIRNVPEQPENICKMAAKRNPMNHMTVTFRKKDVLSAGNYMSFDKFEDYFLWVRMISQGYIFANVKQICVLARVNEKMYERRGGWKYFQQTLKLERYMYSSGFCSKIQFVSNVVVRFLGTVVVPNRVRRVLYRNMLRKRDHDGGLNASTSECNVSVTV